MAVYFVDSNVFFYAKILDREYGKSCAKIIRDVVEGRVEAVTSVLVVVEVANALRKYGLGKEAKEVADAIFSLDIPVYGVDSSDVRIAMGFFDEFGISPYDCVHASVMKRGGALNIISADKDFDKIKLIKRLDPKSYEKP